MVNPTRPVKCQGQPSSKVPRGFSNENVIPSLPNAYGIGKIVSSYCTFSLITYSKHLHGAIGSLAVRDNLTRLQTTYNGVGIRD